MKLDDRRLAANRAMSQNDLVTYDEENPPCIPSVCDSHDLAESTITSRLVPLRSGCENSQPNQDFDFTPLILNSWDSPTQLMDRSSVRHLFFATVNDTRRPHPILRYVPQSHVSCGSGTEDIEGEKQWGFIVRTL